MPQGGGKVRVKPPAFQRDSVDLGRHGRTWQTLEASELEAGDIIKGSGLVEYVSSTEAEVTVGLVWRAVVQYKPDDKVEAFSKKQILTDGSK